MDIFKNSSRMFNTIYQMFKITRPPETYAVSFFFGAIDQSVQLQFRSHVNYVLTQLQLASWVELFLYAAAVFFVVVEIIFHD